MTYNTVHNSKDQSFVFSQKKQFGYKSTTSELEKTKSHLDDEERGSHTNVTIEAERRHDRQHDEGDAAQGQDDLALDLQKAKQQCQKNRTWWRAAADRKEVSGHVCVTARCSTALTSSLLHSAVRLPSERVM